MRKVWRNLLIVAIVSVILSLSVFLLVYFTPDPPVGKMDKARKALSIAGRIRADIYSEKLYAEARISYDSAMANWQKENEKFIYLRNFEKVSMYAEMSEKKANMASENSDSSTLDLKTRLIQKIDTLNNLVSEISDMFYAYPLTPEIRNRISNGKMLLKEAIVAFDNEQYMQSNKLISNSEYLLRASYDFATESLTTYFQSYPLWKKWIDKTIAESKKNSDYSIIIDKFSRKCYIFLNGAQKYEFNAELGSNWVGDKRVRGDMTTPEGMYKITKKLEGNRTRYYKALLLNYPNDEDKARFKSEIAKGLLPASSNIGNLIEIHGNGGKGLDWTEGCIALADKEIDLVYKMAKVGTPVTIVGSMIDLQHVMNK